MGQHPLPFHPPPASFGPVSTPEGSAPPLHLFGRGGDPSTPFVWPRFDSRRQGNPRLGVLTPEGRVSPPSPFGRVSTPEGQPFLLPSFGPISVQGNPSLPVWPRFDTRRRTLHSF